MNRLFILIALTILPFISFGQNKVHNPSFEQMPICPSWLGEFDSLHVTDWHNPTITSPDYFNSCIPGSNCSVPNNAFGTQDPATGNAYAGLDAYDRYSDFREYIVGTLDPLFTGIQYKVTIHISSAYVGLACNSLGVYFYRDGAYTTGGINMLMIPFITPQIDYTNNTPFTDTTNWTELSGVFTADSVYTHLMIGNFNDKNNTDTVTLIPSSPNQYAYYFLDDIAVVPLTPEKLNTVTSPAVTLYPNPASNEITLTNLQQATRITVYNMVGIQHYHSQQMGPQPPITSAP